MNATPQAVVDAATIAFNRGSDARLAGRSTRANPYADAALGRQWLEGWHNVDWGWGRDAKWPVAPLPDVRDVA
jgi:ribosome modulation factor